MYNEKEYATPYAAGLYDLNRLRNMWNKDLTHEEIETKKENVIVFDQYN